MKTKIQAGADIDLLTADELRQTVQGVLKSWSTELTRGVKLRRHAIMGTTDAGGILTAGDNHDGPAEGMAWAVTRLSVVPGPTLGAAGLQVYANDANTPSALMIRNLTTDVFPGDHGCNLLSGDSIRIAGTGITANAQVIVTMQVKEVPIQQIWSL